MKTSQRSGRRRNTRDGAATLKEFAGGKEPNLNELIEEFNWTVDQRDNSVYKRRRYNRDTRDCLWAGQSEDGHKWKPRAGEDEVFPWPGASDARVPLIDKYINEDQAFLMVLWNRMRTLVQGVESNDDQWASRMTHFLRWMKYTQMKESRRENKLLANYVLEGGSGVMGVFWCRMNQLGYDEIDYEGIIGLAQQVAQQAGPEKAQPFIDFAQMILDPTFDDETVKVAAQFYPDVPTARLKKVLEDLRNTGYAKFPRPYPILNRPKVVACEPNVDIFIPPDATSMEDTRGLYRRELLSEAALRERVRSYGWKESWVEQMLETQRGKVTENDNRTSRRQEIYTNGNLNTEKKFEVIHGYRRLADTEGVPGIYYTCFNKNIQDDFAAHELLNYDHGEMPFVLIERETRSRRLDDSRGYGEVGRTWQNCIKASWDGRIDRASIATLPPSFHPQGEAPDRWGPGVQIGTNRPDNYGFFDAPKMDRGNDEVEESVRKFADEYFGRPVDEQNVVQAGILKQEMADNWMAGQVAIDTQVLQLCQQFMDDQFYFRVVGSSKGKAIKSSREEIQGKFDLTITFNVQDFDPEYVKEKMELMQTALQMDVNGIVDRDEAMVAAFELVDPNLGERLLKPAESASQQEIDDEQNVFVKLLAGIPVDVRPGQAYQLRLQVLQQLVMQSSQAQQKMQEDESVKAAFEKRVKQLQFQLQQRQNALIGKLGA